MRWGGVSSHTLRAGSSASRTALVCCPDRKLKLLSSVLQPKSVRALSHILVTPGPALSLPQLVRGTGHLSLIHATTWQMRRGGICFHTFWADLLASLTTGSVLVCCPGELHSVMRDGAIFLEHRGEEWGMGGRVELYPEWAGPALPGPVKDRAGSAQRGSNDPLC